MTDARVPNRAKAAGLLLTILLLACSAIVLAADPVESYAFSSYGPDQGLSNQSVTSLAQDREGFVYVGSEDGLFRYDGLSFLRMGADAGLPGDGITGLYAPVGGGLWVATNKGLVFLAANGVVSPARLADHEVLGISGASRGVILVTTNKGPMLGDADGFKPMPGVPAVAGAGWLSADGKLQLFAARGRLYRRTGTKLSSRALGAPVDAETPQALIRDRRGRLWIRGRRRLARLDSFDAPLQDLSALLPGAAVQKGELQLDALGRVWAPTNKGVVFFDGDAHGVISTRSGLPNEWATTLLRDREGNLWIGSEGVQKVRGRLAWSSSTRRQGLPSDTVWAVTRDQAGTLWVATNRGVAHADASGWRVLPGTVERSFYAFAQDTVSGDFWIGGNSGVGQGNRLLLRPGGAAGFVEVPLSSAKGASTVNSLLPDANHGLYVATLAHGLHRLTRLPVGFRSEQVALPGGNATEQVNQIARASDGRLWAAGMQGLAVGDGTRWRRLGKADGLLETEIETVTPVGDGSAWISYWNVDGLTRITLNGAGTPRLRHVVDPDALVADTVYSAGWDRRGLWLGTALGIKRWRREGVERFARAEGLPGDDAAANAVWAEPSGDMWFGMANGLAHYHAAQDQGLPDPPATNISSVRDGRNRLVAGAEADVPWQARALTFHFAVLSFRDPAQVHRQVRLLGFEDTWRTTGISEARYTGLLPGRYQFQARARYGEGAYGPAVTRIVTILPPWWLTWWFLSLVGVAIAVLGWSILRWRVARLHGQNAALEALVASRTQDLLAANVALEEASMVDPLTGLKNRRYLSIFMPEEQARVCRQHSVTDRDPGVPPKSNIDLCLFMVDLDHFKAVNDTHGHAAGDEVLRQLGAVLRSRMRDSDVVVRWGGEEFLIFARNSDRAKARGIAESLCEAIRSHAFQLADGTFLRKTCSLGFAAFPLLPTQPHRLGWEIAAELADQCLYAAKASGRDGWVGCVIGPEFAMGDAAELPAARQLALAPGVDVVASKGNECLRWTAV